MILDCQIIAMVQRRKEVRTQRTSRYKIKVHLLKNVEMKEYLSRPKIDKQIEGVLTP